MFPTGNQKQGVVQATGISPLNCFSSWPRIHFGCTRSLVVIFVERLRRTTQHLLASCSCSKTRASGGTYAWKRSTLSIRKPGTTSPRRSRKLQWSCWTNTGVRWFGMILVTWKAQEERTRRSCFHDGASLHFLPHVSEGRYRVVRGERQQRQGTGRRASGAIFYCAFCGNKSLTKEMSCVVNMQYDHCVSTSVAFVAEAPPFGPRRSFLEAMVMANNAQKPCGRTSVRRPKWQYNGQARRHLERVVQGRC